MPSWIVLKDASYMENRRTIFGWAYVILTKKEGIMWFTSLKDRSG
ncbi:MULTISPECIES: hypothetical protein [unclassified Oceanobacillus]|nr:MULTISPECIES: hypothetical protein [unclassified Oceanobacillus]